MEKLGISIIVPCHNAGNYLRDCIKSILSQPLHHPFEVIIVNDGSTDKNTLIVLKELQNKKYVKIINFSKNIGVQRARNAGLKIANFEFIFTIDADDCLSTELNILKMGTYADRAVEILNSSPEVAFVHAPWCMFGDYDGLTISSYPVTEALILEKHHVQTSMVYRKKEAFEAGLYCEDIKKWQDWSFAVSLLNSRFLRGKKNKIKFLKEPYYLYRIHNKTDRISTQKVDEKEMISKTVLRHPDIFRNYYSLASNKDIINAVFKNKPSKMQELLYIAANDINTALKITKRRGFKLIGTNEIKNIP